jgi:hypothetical protein
MPIVTTAPATDDVCPLCKRRRVAEHGFCRRCFTDLARQLRRRRIAGYRLPAQSGRWSA